MSPTRHRRRLRHPIAVAFGTAVTITVGYLGISAAYASVTTPNPTTGLIQGLGSARCLSPSADPAGGVTIEDCASQRWTVTGKGEISLGGKCLSARGGGRSDGTVLVVDTCRGRSNQRWSVRSDGTIRGVGSRRCLDVKDRGTDAGSIVQLWQCNAAANQRWRQVTASATPGASPGGTPASPSVPPSNPAASRSANPSAAAASSRASSPAPSGPAAGQQSETVGGGSLASPAVGPAPSSGPFGTGYVLVKNWNFGSTGTVRTMADMSREFAYHDQFGTIANGTNYGAVTVAPDAANAIDGQPVENPDNPVRKLTTDSLKTTLVPLNGASTVSATQHNVGNGSFVAKWAPSAGGSRLGHDMLWETRVRYVTPKYFWFALWTAGTKWDKGAELDLVESFGYDNGGGNTNYDGRYWHADPVGGTATTDYASWDKGMAKHGFTNFDATAYHTWSMLYRTNDTYSFYLDGVEVQSGTMYWTLGGKSGGEPIDMHLLFDAGWGHTQVGSVNKSMPASELAGKYYEFDYSRVYER